MIKNLKNNRFWFWKALETYGIGAMSYSNNTTYKGGNVDGN